MCLQERREALAWSGEGCSGDEDDGPTGSYAGTSGYRNRDSEPVMLWDTLQECIVEGDDAPPTPAAALKVLSINILHVSRLIIELILVLQVSNVLVYTCTE